MSTSSSNFDLNQRCIRLAQNVASFTTTLPKTAANLEYSKQIIRSSASIGANYLEAGESLSRKDFIHRVRIARKEAKETNYWLELIQSPVNLQKKELLQESIELVKILSTIASKAALKVPSDKTR